MQSNRGAGYWLVGRYAEYSTRNVRRSGRSAGRNDTTREKCRCKEVGEVTGVLHGESEPGGLGVRRRLRIEDHSRVKDAWTHSVRTVRSHSVLVQRRRGVLGDEMRARQH